MVFHDSRLHGCNSSLSFYVLVFLVSSQSCAGRESLPSRRFTEVWRACFQLNESVLCGTFIYEVERKKALFAALHARGTTNKG